MKLGVTVGEIGHHVGSSWSLRVLSHKNGMCVGGLSSLDSSCSCYGLQLLCHIFISQQTNKQNPAKFNFCGNSV